MTAWLRMIESVPVLSKCLMLGCSDMLVCYSSTNSVTIRSKTNQFLVGILASRSSLTFAHCNPQVLYREKTLESVIIPAAVLACYLLPYVENNNLL